MLMSDQMRLQLGTTSFLVLQGRKDRVGRMQLNITNKANKFLVLNKSKY